MTEPRPEPSRTVHCEDALAWLRREDPLGGCSFVTSLPDVSELPALDLAGWRAWFLSAAELVLTRCPPQGVSIFFQTDIKLDGTWVDKGYLVSAAAERAGVPLLWHKVVCRRPPGTTTHGRPAYAHLLCFSREVRDDVARSTPDVLPDAGAMTWSKAMAESACRAACRYVLERTSTRTVVDPFCGRGTALAVANGLGLDAIGVELSRKRARQARALRWSPALGFHKRSSIDAAGRSSVP